MEIYFRFSKNFLCYVLNLKEDSFFMSFVLNEKIMTYYSKSFLTAGLVQLFVLLKPNNIRMRIFRNVKLAFGNLAYNITDVSL